MEVQDLVCGMRFAAADAVANVEYADETYYFCAEGCRRMFERDPGRFLGRDLFVATRSSEAEGGGE